MELSNEPVGPVPPPLSGRKAAWWAWPLIVLCLIPFERWFAPEPVAKQEAAAVRETGAATLALLKFQSQVVIATAKLDPAASAKALDDLGRTVSGNRGLAALALLESFVAPQSPRAGRVVERFTDGMPQELRSLVGQAVESGLAEPERDRLRSSLGWFAELARSPGLEAPPLEGEIRARALIVVAVIGLGFTVVAFGVLAGAVLLVLHLRRTKAGGAANAFVPVSRHGGVLLECFALHLGLMTLGAWLSPWLGGYSGIVGYGLAVVFPLVWARLRGVRWRDFRAATGLHRGRGVWREIGAGCVGYLGVMAVASIGIGLTLLLTLV
ncbi:MAG TPA: hypothetical protein PLA50_11770, partial [Bacteroidia bacterium]|nr:hypothetical protein [Bacteroidia bacterium]